MVNLKACSCVKMCLSKSRLNVNEGEGHLVKLLSTEIEQKFKPFYKGEKCQSVAVQSWHKPQKAFLLFSPNNYALLLLVHLIKKVDMSKYLWSHRTI